MEEQQDIKEEPRKKTSPSVSTIIVLLLLLFAITVYGFIEKREYQILIPYQHIEITPSTKTVLVDEDKYEENCQTRDYELLEETIISNDDREGLSFGIRNNENESLSFSYSVLFTGLDGNGSVIQKEEIRGTGFLNSFDKLENVNVLSTEDFSKAVKVEYLLDVIPDLVNCEFEITTFKREVEVETAIYENKTNSIPYIAQRSLWESLFYDYYN